MKKVVLFANSTWCIYNFRLNLMQTLLKQGYQVHVLAPLDPTYENSIFLKKFDELKVTFHDVPLEPRGLNPFREILSILAVFRLLRSIKADVVLSYTVKCNLYAGFCRQILGFDQIANVPGLGEVFERKNLLYVVVSNLYRAAFRGMSTAFFQNREDLDFCLKCKLVAQDKCVLIPGSGVDLSRFKPAFPPRSQEKRIFLMFGRLLPKKGYFEYLQAAEELKKLLGERVECWVMGIEDKNRPDSTALYQTLKDAERRGVIRMVPTTVDVVPWLKEVDAVVLPSRYNEGIPRSLLEAMAMGKVIITTDWRGCRETVEQGKNGFLVSTSNNSAINANLTQAMLKIAEMESGALRSMGEYSRKLVENRYDEQLVLQQYMNALESNFAAREAAESRVVGQEFRTGTR